jgi:hypothetical protein
MAVVPMMMAAVVVLLVPAACDGRCNAWTPQVPMPSGVRMAMDVPTVAVDEGVAHDLILNDRHDKSGD